uniref:Uncharacterized protein n=1 Tax=Oryza brachyantha TaxID=4533 RepID=J3KV70_ORYBR
MSTFSKAYEQGQHERWRDTGIARRGLLIRPRFLKTKLLSDPIPSEVNERRLNIHEVHDVIYGEEIYLHELNEAVMHVREAATSENLEQMWWGSIDEWQDPHGSDGGGLGDGSSAHFVYLMPCHHFHYNHLPCSVPCICGSHMSVTTYDTDEKFDK